ncbi:hypothetical protein GCM10023169_24000 [Georgenia halophila]|uniref:Extracellular solute-binding protein n=1 Tax=Georgenia halophila TaxID=620889 RepID=A0ABP8LBH6_9MICO
MNVPIRRAGVGVLATVALALTGCATSGSGDGNDQTEPTEVSDEITDEPVTLRLAYTDDPPTEALVDGFTEKYPNVTIETEQTGFSNYISSITRSMSSEDAPDIAQYNPGAMRSLVPAGEVLDLEQYSDLYSWEESFPPASLEQLMSDEEAKEFGTGSLYAAPGGLSVLGVYYNKEMLEEAGVDSLPSTLDEFVEAMDTVEQAGTRPLSLGALQVGAIHL